MELANALRLGVEGTATSRAVEAQALESLWPHGHAT
jgi:hypothetical protein